MIAVLASDGERFTSFERGASTCYVGRSCAENIGRFSFFPLEGAKLVDTLFGGVPLIGASVSVVTWDSRAGAYRVERTGYGGATQLIWVTPKTWDVRRMEVARAGAVEISIAFEDITVVAGERLPHTIVMKMPAEEVDLRVRYREVDLNTTLGAGPFQIPCPDGVQNQTLRCDDELPDTEGLRDVTPTEPGKDEADGK
jgi:outer membrane lipoprotein-sorting protein